MFSSLSNIVTESSSSTASQHKYGEILSKSSKVIRWKQIGEKIIKIIQINGGNTIFLKALCMAH